MTATRDIAGIAEEEQRIYNMLEQTNFAAGQTTVPTQPNFPPTPTHNVPTSANFTPIRSQTEEPVNAGKNLQQDIRTMLAQSGDVQLSPEALQLIN